MTKNEETTKSTKNAILDLRKKQARILAVRVALRTLANNPGNTLYDCSEVVENLYTTIDANHKTNEDGIRTLMDSLIVVDTIELAE